MYSGLMVPFLFMATGYRCHLPSIFANFVKVTVGALLIISSEFPTKNLQGSKSLGVHRHNHRHNAEKVQAKPTPNAEIFGNGGEGGIRTPDTLSGMPVFKTGAI